MNRRLAFPVSTTGPAAMAIALAIGAGSCGGGGGSAGGVGVDAGTGADGTVKSACTTDSDCAALVPPTTPVDCAAGTCNVVQGTCVFSARDEDGDGHPAADCQSTNGIPIVDGDDCNDHDPNLYAGHPEPCTPVYGGDDDGGYCPVGQTACLPDGTQSACSSTCTECKAMSLGCLGTQPAACNAAGTAWQARLSDCAGLTATPVCLDGTCVECIPGTTTCSGQQPQTCDATRTWQPSGAACVGQTCVGGACTGVCAPNQTRCSGSAVQSCDANGQWGSATACAQPTPDCAGGACICAGSLDGGAVDTMSDPHNCGTCGHDCLGGACTTGVCQPVTLASLPPNQSGSYDDIAVDATSVYWTNQGGSVMKVALGGGFPTALATGQVGPASIAIDATNVYWRNRDGSVMKVALGGGTPTRLASAQDAYFLSGLAVDARGLYWTDSTYGAVMQVPLGGGTPTLIANHVNQTSSTFIANDGTNLYWSDPGAGTITKIATSTYTTTTLASAQTNPQNIAVDATSAYWTSQGGSVMKVALGGGTPTTLASGQNSPGSIAADGTSVYFAAGNALMRVAAGGGTPTKLASSGAIAIAVDPTFVYWTTGAAVMKVAK